MFKSILKWGLIVISSGLVRDHPLGAPHLWKSSIDIKDSKFVDHLYIDWPVAKRQYASKADVVGLPYLD